MRDKLIDSNEFTDTYQTSMGIITVWKKDGKDKNGVGGKEGTSVMAYDTPPVKMKLKRKHKG